MHVLFLELCFARRLLIRRLSLVAIAMEDFDAKQVFSAHSASDAEGDDVVRNDSGVSRELDELYGALGRALFEKTKGIEELYLLAPDIYLAIERMESGR